jgi:hypothetical protein
MNSETFLLIVAVLIAINMLRLLVRIEDYYYRTERKKSDDLASKTYHNHQYKIVMKESCKFVPTISILNVGSWMYPGMKSYTWLYGPEYETYEVAEASAKNYIDRNEWLSPTPLRDEIHEITGYDS